MPRDWVYGDWAASGEIDAMENRGQEPARIFGTIHFGGQWPTNDQSHGANFVFPGGNAGTNFHLYTIEWTTNEFRWYVDGLFYQSQTNWWTIGGPYPAPFNQLFYIILNLAVGGYFVGSPDATTVFPGEMQVDYVRVYDFVPDPVPPPVFTGASVVQNRLVLTGTNGPPGATFYIVASPNTTLPQNRWPRVGTNQFNSSGGFTHSLPPVSSPSYYRILVP
jgi:beta-glucanase (GH16 family)